MGSLIFGILCVIGGLAYLINLWTRRASATKDSWTIAMLTKGLFGGIGVIAIGITLIVKNWAF